MRTTLFTLLLTVNILLRRAREPGEQVCLMSVISGREEPILYEVVGYLADRIYRVVDLTSCQTAVDVVREVERVARESGPHQFLRFDRLRREIIPSGQDLPAPGFNFVALAPQTQRSSTVLEWSPPPFALAPPPTLTQPGVGIADYWIELHETADGLRGHVRFKGEVAEDITPMFIDLVGRMAENPQAPFGRAV